MVLNHPATLPKTDPSKTNQEAGLGRMRDHGFFLMLRAVRAYQDRYLPKLETVGLSLSLSLIEKRILLVLNDLCRQLTRFSA